MQRQTYANIEHLIVDGASTDSTLEVVERLAKDSTRIISEKDNGIYDALNKGIGMATGEVIGFLHADDAFESDTVLATIAGIMADSTVQACYSDLVYVQEDDDEKIVRNWQSSPFENGLFIKGWMPPHPTFYTRKSVYAKFGVFDTNLKIGADWDLLVRLLEIGKIETVYHPEVWVRMRLGGTSNRSFSNVLHNNVETWKQCCRYFGFFPSLLFPPRKWLHRLKQFWV